MKKTIYLSFYIHTICLRLLNKDEIMIHVPYKGVFANSKDTDRCVHQSCVSMAFVFGLLILEDGYF